MISFFIYIFAVNVESEVGLDVKVLNLTVLLLNLSET